MMLTWRRSSLAVALLCAAASASAQAPRPKELAVGRLLVAARDLPDPNFAATVILLVRYGQDGALGLALNRPTTVPISRALKELPAAQNRSEPVFIGGPVGRRSVFALLRSKSAASDGDRILDSVYFVADAPALTKTLGEKHDDRSLRVYLGYSGWAEGQLENEVRQGAWHILNPSADEVFDPDPASLWPRMVSAAERKIAQSVFKSTPRSAAWSGVTGVLDARSFRPMM